MLTPIKQRYSFAMSAFVRMYGRKSLSDLRIKQFCLEWAELDIHAPLDDTVDQYFHYEYKNWRGV